jgi:hypothetical protein
MGHCSFCGAEFPTEKIFFGDSCDECSRDLHVCVNCEYYDLSSPNECREPAADKVTDKERKNFCDFFKPKSDGDGKADFEKKRQDLFNAAEDLFKKK